MTDEELLGYLRRSSVGYTHPLRLAADRIEALVKERQAAYAKGFSDAEAEISATAIGQQNAFLHAQLARAKARVEKLREALDSIATELTGVVPEPDNIWMAIHTAVSVARAALKPVAAPDPALRPTMTDMMVDPDTLDAFMEAKPLPPDPAAIREAWEKAYWRMRSYAVHDNDCKLNKPPRFDGPCSCGLTAALEEALALIQKGGDACDKNPIDARPATSPGVTAGADAAQARPTATVSDDGGIRVMRGDAASVIEAAKILRDKLLVLVPLERTDAAQAREEALRELIDAYEDIMDYGIVFAKKDQQDRLKAAKEKLANG